MTNKEIIIDGVDVSGCEDFGLRLSNKKVLEWCHNYDDHCKDYPNCYYKQLQRKEQECETQQKALEIQKGFLDNSDFQIKTLKAENEELKKENISFKDFVKHQMCYVYSKNWFESFVDGFEDWEKDLIKKSDRSKQALKDIEEIINHCDNQDICALCKNADKCRDKYDYTAYNDHKLLLAIINEVKDE